MYQDIWAQDPFKAVTMTNAISIMPHVASEMMDAIGFEVDTSLTADAALDIENNQIYLLPIVGRGAPLPVSAREKRRAVKFSIPRMGETATVLNSEVMGVRETGTINMRTLTSLAAKKLQMINLRISHSANYAIARALDGLVVDGTSGDIVEDVNAVLGTTQIVQTWDFSNANLDPNALLGSIKRIVEDGLGQAQFSADRYTLLCGRKFYRAFRNLNAVKEAFKDFSEKTFALRFLQTDRTAPGGFVFADDVTVVDVGNARVITSTYNNGMVDDSTSYLVPNIVSGGFARCILGPSELTEFLGNIQPIYAAQGEDSKFSQGLDIMAETYRMYYFSRPDAIVKIVGTNLPT